MQQLSSAISSQANSILSSSSADSSGAILTLRSNLSCYVCMTVDDMRCKFINETNKHLYQLEEDLAKSSRSPKGHHHSMDNHNQAEVQAMLTSYGSIHGDGSLMTTSTEILDVDQDSSGANSAEYNSGNSNTLADHIFGTDCLPDEHYCQVLRMGVSPERNPQSQEYNFFALIRSCAKQCNPGCFIIGNGRH